MSNPELDRYLDRIRRAVASLENAAGDAQSAADDLADANGTPDERAITAQLIDAIERAHQDQHDGGFQWCGQELCQLAVRARVESTTPTAGVRR
jgi:hypothetical protein